MSDDEPERNKFQWDLLWGIYTDVRAHSRHAETLRSNAANYILVIASALAAVVLADRKVDSGDLPLCLSIIGVGLFGLAFIATYTELYQRNRRRAETVRRILDGVFFPEARVSFTNVIEDSDEVHETSRIYRWSRKLTGSSHRFWLLLPMLVITIGATLTAIAL